MSTDQDKHKVEAVKGSFVRNPTKFHDSISTSPDAKYPPEAGRYRLYVSYACPWASRCLMVRKLKGLEEVISLTITGYRLDNLSTSNSKSKESSKYRGWNFEKDQDKESIFYNPHGFEYLDELYEHAHPGYRKEYEDQGKRAVYSVPVLFDEKTQTIVSNESAEIIKMFNSEFNSVCLNPDLDLEPKGMVSEMNRVDAIVYPHINDGVYRMGFAKTQEAYEKAYVDHWRAMDQVEAILSEKKFLCGDEMTLSDVRLFVTLIRYDPVYYAHFKGSRNKVKDMPNMFRYLCQIYQMPGIKDTVDFDHIVKHYYGSQLMVNPTGIYPVGALKIDADLLKPNL
mmetsp:Transcript_11848/g.13663  ORF Transcript_11848/g.13663 Transcript_11848/m.13663 type:complete len:339 (+) Transcript_11848:80-1096(+)|eukprot:CAMPEP_0184024322 /NCGR_PEP_ID=MMETSP0954-20121128/12002_1 /TAXON_ID=627963 /ORGANISM="Aplanochytrium sp, Strain PBS07" /LENGTH=338 /DNA_ID=CAMNT_0026307605 /DNA_START=33 /DNA_END=1049 /DNA_ORIENTATION=-